MRNYVQPGNIIDVVTPAGGFVSGRGYVIGSLFGVAAATTAEGEINSLHTTGVFELPTLHAPEDVISVGDKAYFFAMMQAIYNIPPFSADTYEIGVIVGRSGSTVQVRLNGIAVESAAA